MFDIDKLTEKEKKEASDARMRMLAREHRNYRKNEYRAEARAGDGYAMYKVGVKYYQGEWIVQDYKEALKWFNKSIETGEPYAHRYLVYMYYEGTGVEKDYKKVVYHGRKSIEYDGSTACGIMRKYVKEAGEYLKNNKVQDDDTEGVKKNLWIHTECGKWYDETTIEIDTHPSLYAVMTIPLFMQL